MRRVVDRYKVVSLWAAQTQPDARTPNGSLSFQGPDLISYRTRIATILPGSDGRQHTIVSTYRYSVTTTRQQSDAWRTARTPCHRVPCPIHGASLETIRAEWIRHVDALADAGLQCRTDRARALAHNEWRDSIYRLGLFCAGLGLPGVIVTQEVGEVDYRPAEMIPEDYHA